MTVIGILFGNVDDSGFPRTSDRPIKLLGTCVRYQRYVETSIGARGPDFLGGSATSTMKETLAARKEKGSLLYIAYSMRGFSHVPQNEAFNMAVYLIWLATRGIRAMAQ